VIELLVGHRTVALLLACLLASLTMLGLGSSPPEVELSEIPRLEDGMKVYVRGMLVELWKYETGSESLVLADLAGTDTVKVLSSQGTRPQPSKYVDLGDELLVLGELSKSGAVDTIFAASDCISVTKESEEVLTVDILRDCWSLFRGDHVRIRGLLDYDDLGTSLRLYSLDRNSSLLASINAFDPSRFLGSRVLVSGILSLDARTLVLELVVSSIVLDA